MKNVEILQSVIFDLYDLIYSNPSTKNTKIEGLQEFKTLGEFLEYQKNQLEAVEIANS